VNDATWRYSKALLVAYEGDLDKAYREYRDAFAAPLNVETVPIQSEEFIHLLLEGDPNATGSGSALDSSITAATTI
jgi:hypothetical protein